MPKMLGKEVAELIRERRVAPAWQGVGVAYEWVAPLATSVIGLAGITATYLTAKRQVATARAVVHDQAAAALRAQREERNQKRIETACPSLLDALSENNAWLWKLESFVFHEPESMTPPAQPDNVLKMPHRGAHPATWSPRVAQLADEWTIAAASASTHARFMGYLREEQPNAVPGNTDGVEPMDYLEGRASRADHLGAKFKPAHARTHVLNVEIRNQVWRELRSEDNGDAPEAIDRVELEHASVHERAGIERRRWLRDLTATDVDRWLLQLAKNLSTSTVQRVYECLNRVVIRAMARDKVGRNVVALCGIPTGMPVVPRSRSPSTPPRRS
jgi:hypothetical protein